MNKVTSENFREEKKITLPSGIEITCVSALLIGELPTSIPNDNDLDGNLNVIVKMIREWNFYDTKESEKPCEINLENFKKLPASDFQHLMGELKVFSTEQKKS